MALSSNQGQPPRIQLRPRCFWCFDGRLAATRGRDTQQQCVHQCDLVSSVLRSALQPRPHSKTRLLLVATTLRCHCGSDLLESTPPRGLGRKEISRLCCVAHERHFPRVARWTVEAAGCVLEAPDAKPARSCRGDLDRRDRELGTRPAACWLGVDGAL